MGKSNGTTRASSKNSPKGLTQPSRASLYTSTPPAGGVPTNYVGNGGEPIFRMGPGGAFMNAAGQFMFSSDVIKLSAKEKSELNAVQDAYRLSNNQFLELNKMKVDKTPGGNWALYYDGKSVSTINGRIIREATLRKLGMLR